jgi:CheY-like chemotaxis protein
MTIKVKDTGIGITREFYEVIFEPFRQESEGWGRNFEGTGLGLSITKRFVELMKGKIEVESEFGVGSTFTVRLPFTEPDATKEVKTKEKESAKKAIGELIQEKKELSILLVEDDEVNLLYTLTVLNKHYKTEFAKDGYSAIEAAKKKKYDIILMDINLGKEIDGIMATQEIRKMKGYENTPIVALTAYVREGDKEEFLAGGCTHFLGKPFTVKQLLELVEQLQ